MTPIATAAQHDGLANFLRAAANNGNGAINSPPVPRLRVACLPSSSPPPQRAIGAVAPQQLAIAPLQPHRQLASHLHSHAEVERALRF
jgi:hypothetical protein